MSKGTMVAKNPERLPPYGRWHWLWRSTFELEYRGSLLVVDVDYFDFSEKIRLYRDNVLVTEGSSPVALKVDDCATVEAALSLYGMRYVRLIRQDSGESAPFRPGPGTGEDRRMRFAARHPVIDQILSVCSWVVLVVALVTQIPEILHVLGALVDMDIPTFDLPTGLNITLQIAGVLAGLDRALRMKFNRWLDETSF